MVTIKNFGDLATSGRKRDCLEILAAGLQAADPSGIMPRFVTPGAIRAGGTTLGLGGYSAIHLVAFGKAADAMARAVNAIVPIKSGIVVIPRGSRSQVRGKKFQIFNSGHPRPDRTSVRAAKEVLKFVQNRRSGELVIFLVSGGGSALLALPDRITLADKVHATDVLLKSGATIQEFNCVRKHLSGIKGGKLVRGMRCDGIGLVMSDVEGDDLASIASGTTHADDTTYADALSVIDRYGLRRKMPQEVLDVLEGGTDPDGAKVPAIENHVIATNADCLAAMRRRAGELGYATRQMSVFGGIKDAVAKLAGSAPRNPKECLVFGGETTVRVLGKGAGGRNQEMVLRLLKNTQGMERIAIASAGTDGIDGNTQFAGAITENVRTDPGTIKEFLRNSDSGRFFQKRRGSIITGPTHTNLMDIGVMLR